MCLFQDHEDWVSQFTSEGALPQVGEKPFGRVGHYPFFCPCEVENRECHRLQDCVQVDRRLAPDRVLLQFADVPECTSGRDHLAVVNRRSFGSGGVGRGRASLGIAAPSPSDRPVRDVVGRQDQVKLGGAVVEVRKLGYDGGRAVVSCVVMNIFEWDTCEVGQMLGEEPRIEVDPVATEADAGIDHCLTDPLGIRRDAGNIAYFLAIES